MSRSVWKGPFVDMYLMKKAETVKSSGRNDVIKTWSRRSTILPEFVGLTFGVTMEKNIYLLLLMRIWWGINLVSFLQRELTKDTTQTKRQNKMTKQTSENTAQAIGKSLKTSIQKANLVLSTIRGKKLRML